MTKSPISDETGAIDGLVWGSWDLTYFTSMPESQYGYVHIVKSLEGRLEEIDRVATKVFLKAGEKECLRDDIILFSKTLGKVHMDETLGVQKNAVHANPIFDFAAKVTLLITKRMRNWIA
ncbi:hypothetical protein M422DRAFT_266187 [Sphaerobolus stellatus SS14]|uniref:Uncharacterized protein n=1 Tax=Sphaerobolus stellatus (strain SS14) TaxID=990650 RepID=A0A0C9USB6_SPHS4|nr:hypothetical protein M422DRAFT_266187 [Sphaerobolus stellatus SS14]